jgi:hypothetical protein
MRAAIVAFAIALAVPAAAAAKEVSRVDVCGADGCGRITDHGALAAFMEGDDRPATVPYGAQRSYAVKVYVRDDTGATVHGWTSHWIPRSRVLAFEDEQGQWAFTDVPSKLERALRGAARGRTAQRARTFADKPDPEAQVDEVFAPATATVARAGDEDGGLPTLAWLGLAAGLLAVGGAGAVGLRRR